MTTQTDAQDQAISSQPDPSVKTKSISPSQEEERQSLFTPAVEFRNVRFFFDDEIVLDGISFTVMRGEIKITYSVT